MKVRIRTTGIDISRSLARLGKGGTEAAKRVLIRTADEIVPAAKAIAPVDPEDGGQLRDSIRRGRPSVTKNQVSVAVIAGGAPLAPFLEGRRANVYAVIQHEDTTLQHVHGESHFIEKPAKRIVVSVPGRLLEELDKEAEAAVAAG